MHRHRRCVQHPSAWVVYLCYGQFVCVIGSVFVQMRPPVIVAPQVIVAPPFIAVPPIIIITTTHHHHHHHRPTTCPQQPLPPAERLASPAMLAAAATTYWHGGRCGPSLHCPAALVGMVPTPPQWQPRTHAAAALAGGRRAVCLGGRPIVSCTHGGRPCSGCQDWRR